MGHHWVALWTATEKKSFYQTQNTNQNVHFQIYKHQQHITKIYWGLFCNINQLNIARKEQACAIYNVHVHVCTCFDNNKIPVRIFYELLQDTTNVLK